MATTKRYTTTELAFIREHAGKLTSKEIGAALGRSELAIRSIASVYNIRLSHRYRTDAIARAIQLRDSEGRTWREVLNIIHDEFGILYSESGLQRGYQRVKLATRKNTDPDRLRMLNEIHRCRIYDKLPWAEIQKRIEKRYGRYYPITTLCQMYKRHCNRLLGNEEILA